MTRNCILSLLAASMLLCTLSAVSAQQQTQPQTQPRENIGDQIPHSWGGLPEGAPPRPKTVDQTPAVHDLPPPRATKTLTGDQQLQLQKEMSAARTRNLSFEDPNAEKKAEKAAKANAAAIDTARKKARKPAAKPAQ